MTISKIKTNKKDIQKLASEMKKFEKEQALINKPVSLPFAPRDPNLPICIVVDIDGTLAHKGDRNTFDFERSIDDTAVFQLLYILQLIDDANKWVNSAVPKTHIILVTGREQLYSAVTNRWLNRHQIPFDHIYMRRTGDRRPSNIVKEEILASMIEGKYNVLFAIDDRGQDIDMYRSHGLYVLVADNSRE